MRKRCTEGAYDLLHVCFSLINNVGLIRAPVVVTIMSDQPQVLPEEYCRWIYHIFLSHCLWTSIFDSSVRCCRRIFGLVTSQSLASAPCNAHIMNFYVLIQLCLFMVRWVALEIISSAQLHEAYDLPYLFGIGVAGLPACLTSVSLSSICRLKNRARHLAVYPYLFQFLARRFSSWKWKTNI